MKRVVFRALVVFVVLSYVEGGEIRVVLFMLEVRALTSTGKCNSKDAALLNLFVWYCYV